MTRPAAGALQSATADDGATITYTVAGDGAPMLIMNGLVSSVNPHWRAWVRHYRARWSVVAWDYRGHGATPVPADVQTIGLERFADDAATVLGASGVPGPAVVCGISMGVQSTLEFYRRHPAQVRALVLICGTAGHALNRLHSSPALRRGVARVVRRVGRTPGLLKGVLAPLAGTRLGPELAFLTGGASRKHLSPEVMTEVFRHAAQLDARVFSRIVAAYLEHSAADVLDGVVVPTLIVAGEKDDLTPVAAAKAMHHRIRGSELHIVRGHSHLAQVEKPEEVHGVVDSFLRRHALA